MKKALLFSIMAGALAAGAPATAETAGDILDPAGVAPLTTAQPPAKIIVDQPLAEPLTRGYVFIQYRAENLRIEPVFGPNALDVTPRIGHTHVTVDGAPWHWADASGEPIILVGLPAGRHSVEVILANANHQPLDTQMIAINVRGVFLSVQAAVPHMVDGGRVITIGSNAAIRTGFPGSSVYQFTKAAVAAMVKGLALDLAPRKITVNNVQPGPTNTDITAGAIDMLSDISPLKRVADPAEIAGVVSYLARGKAGFMSGASLTIDGGLTL
jgi:NAD(P)-dependent dehydrogenase (short-subunit alcohol dehydrogenase family)